METSCEFDDLPAVICCNNYSLMKEDDDHDEHCSCGYRDEHEKFLMI